MPYPEDQITTVNQLLASERDKTELRNSLSVDLDFGHFLEAISV